MRHLLSTLLLLLLLTSCQKNGIVRYQMEGGDPEIDFLEVQGDTLCRFYGPGNILIECPCRMELQNILTIEVAPLIEARLVFKDPQTLQGEPPFFEGTWLRQ